MPTFSPCELDELRQRMSSFCAEREWGRFHTPRNLLLALVGEVGELAELFQWRGEPGADAAARWSEADRVALEHELADVQLYLVRLSDVLGVDLPAACRAKMARNAVKYPADRAKGRSDKYTVYEAAGGSDVPPPASPAAVPQTAAPQTAAFAAAALLGAAVLGAAAAWRAAAW